MRGALALALAGVLGRCGAIRSAEDVRVGGRVMGQYMQWGALAGARLCVNLTLRGQAPDGDFVWVLLADDGQFAAVLALSGESVCKPAGGADLSQAQYSRAAARMGAWNASEPLLAWGGAAAAPASSTYHFLFLSCAGVALDFDTSLHFVNPGGEELSSGEIAY